MDLSDTALEELIAAEIDKAFKAVFSQKPKLVLTPNSINKRKAVLTENPNWRQVHDVDKKPRMVFLKEST